MRSSIDAGEYKDYILGFVFYKFLSENEVAFLRRNDWEDEDIRQDLSEDNEDDVEFIKGKSATSSHTRVFFPRGSTRRTLQRETSSTPLAPSRAT